MKYCLSLNSSSGNLSFSKCLMRTAKLCCVEFVTYSNRLLVAQYLHANTLVAKGKSENNFIKKLSHGYGVI